MTYTDNVYRLAQGTSDVVFGEDLGFQYDRTTPRLFADIDGAVTRYDFAKDSYRGETLPRLRLLSTYDAISDFLSATIEDNYGQIAPDAFGEISPGSLENVNYLTVGPDLSAPLGAVTNAKLRLRYSRAWFQRSDIDNRRYAGELDLSHAFSPVRSLTVYYYAGRVEFDRSLVYAPYDTRSAGLDFKSISRFGTVAVDAGETQVQTSSQTQGGLLADIRFTRQLGPGTWLELDALRDYADTAEDFRLGQSAPISGLVSANVQNKPDPFLDRSVLGLIRFERTRVFGGISLQYESEKYMQTIAADRHFVSGDLQLGYKISPWSSIMGEAQYLHDTFDFSGSRDDERYYAIRYSYLVRSSLRVDVQVERYTGLSTIFSNFAENRVAIGLTYSPSLPSGPMLSYSGSYLNGRLGMGGVSTP